MILDMRKTLETHGLLLTGMKRPALKESVDFLILETSSSPFSDLVVCVDLAIVTPRIFNCSVIFI